MSSTHPDPDPGIASNGGEKMRPLQGSSDDEDYSSFDEDEQGGPEVKADTRNQKIAKTVQKRLDNFLTTISTVTYEECDFASPAEIQDWIESSIQKCIDELNPFDLAQFTKNFSLHFSGSVLNQNDVYSLKHFYLDKSQVKWKEDVGGKIEEVFSKIQSSGNGKELLEMFSMCENVSTFPQIPSPFRTKIQCQIETFHKNHIEPFIDLTKLWTKFESTAISGFQINILKQILLACDKLSDEIKFIQKLESFLLSNCSIKLKRILFKPPQPMNKPEDIDVRKTMERFQSTMSQPEVHKQIQERDREEEMVSSENLPSWDVLLEQLNELTIKQLRQWNEIELSIDFMTKFQKLISHSFRPCSYETKNEILILSGSSITMSEEIQKIRQILTTTTVPKIYQISINASIELVLDIDMDSSQDPIWKGLNLAINTVNLSVVTNNNGPSKKFRVIDVSGKNGKSSTTNPATSSSSSKPGDDGADGQDGEPGESGGNVLIQTKRFRNSKQLKIISNGGNGGNGQPGGDGRDGQNGDNGDDILCQEIKARVRGYDQMFSSPLTLSRFHEELFPSPNKCSGAKAGQNWRTSQNNLNNLAATVHCTKKEDNTLYKHVTLYGGAVVHFSAFRPTYYISTWLPHVYVWLIGGPGTNGQWGGYAGRGGRGGMGGNGGKIEIIIGGKKGKGLDVIIENVLGGMGRPGNDGRAGVKGRDGVQGKDFAYVDYGITSNEVYYEGKLTRRFNGKTKPSDVAAAWCMWNDEWTYFTKTEDSRNVIQKFQKNQEKRARAPVRESAMKSPISKKELMTDINESKMFQDEDSSLDALAALQEKASQKLAETTSQQLSEMSQQMRVSQRMTQGTILTIQKDSGREQVRPQKLSELEQKVLENFRNFIKIPYLSFRDKRKLLFPSYSCRNLVHNSVRKLVKKLGQYLDLDDQSEKKDSKFHHVVNVNDLYKLLVELRLTTRNDEDNEDNYSVAFETVWRHELEMIFVRSTRFSKNGGILKLTAPSIMMSKEIVKLLRYLELDRKIQQFNNTQSNNNILDDDDDLNPIFQVSIGGSVEIIFDCDLDSDQNEMLAGLNIHLDSSILHLKSPMTTSNGQQRIINVSGGVGRSAPQLKPRSYKPSKKGQGKVGRDGQDGEAGESGGNILVRFDWIQNDDGTKMILISNGGKGGLGQPGGDGQKGQDGLTGDEIFLQHLPHLKLRLEEKLNGQWPSFFSMNEFPILDTFIKLFPSPSIPDKNKAQSSLDSCRNSLNIFSTTNSIEPSGPSGATSAAADAPVNIKKICQFSKQVHCESGAQIHFSYCRPSIFKKFLSALNPLSDGTAADQTYFLFLGASGIEGAPGGLPGRGGRGGNGGLRGNIQIILPNEFKSFVIGKAIDGDIGENGPDGIIGYKGADGVQGMDFAYLDYDPKFPLECYSGFLTQKFSQEKSKKVPSVWCPQKKAHLSIKYVLTSRPALKNDYECPNEQMERPPIPQAVEKRPIQLEFPSRIVVTTESSSSSDEETRVTRPMTQHEEVIETTNVTQESEVIEEVIEPTNVTQESQVIEVEEVIQSQVAPLVTEQAITPPDLIQNSEQQKEVKMDTPSTPPIDPKQVKGPNLMYKFTKLEEIGQHLLKSQVTLNAFTPECPYPPKFHKIWYAESGLNPRPNFQENQNLKSKKEIKSKFPPNNLRSGWSAIFGSKSESGHRFCSSQKMTDLKQKLIKKLNKIQFVQISNSTEEEAAKNCDLSSGHLLAKCLNLFQTESSTVEEKEDEKEENQNSIIPPKSTKNQKGQPSKTEVKCEKSKSKFDHELITKYINFIFEFGLIHEDIQLLASVFEITIHLYEHDPSGRWPELKLSFEYGQPEKRQAYRNRKRTMKDMASKVKSALRFKKLSSPQFDLKDIASQSSSPQKKKVEEEEEEEEEEPIELDDDEPIHILYEKEGGVYIRLSNYEQRNRLEEARMYSNIISQIMASSDHEPPPKDPNENVNDGRPPPKKSDKKIEIILTETETNCEKILNRNYFDNLELLQNGPTKIGQNFEKNLPSVPPPPSSHDEEEDGRLKLINSISRIITSNLTKSFNDKNPSSSSSNSILNLNVEQLEEEVKHYLIVIESPQTLQALLNRLDVQGLLLNDPIQFLEQLSFLVCENASSHCHAGTQFFPILEWIFLTTPQENWLNEMALLQFEKATESFSAGQLNKWRQLLHLISKATKMKDSTPLVTLLDKLHAWFSFPWVMDEEGAGGQETCSLKREVKLTTLDLILEQFGRIKIWNEDTLYILSQQELIFWPETLESAVILSDFTELFSWYEIQNGDESDQNFQKGSYFLLANHNNYKSLLEEFMKEAKRTLKACGLEYLVKKGKIDPTNFTEEEMAGKFPIQNFHQLVELLSKIYYCRQPLDSNLISIIRSCSTWEEFWRELLKFSTRFPPRDAQRSIQEIVALILEDGNGSLSKERIQWAGNVVETVRPMSKEQRSPDYFKNWVKNLRQNSIRMIEVEDCLQVIDEAIYHCHGFYLREAQKMAITLLASSESGILSQVWTGEGKSLIVASTAIIKGLRGEKCDVITSSPILAQRDAEENEKLYGLFDLTVSHNAATSLEDRKTAYVKNIVYGDASDFQRDFLLTKFYGENVLGKRSDMSETNAIIDEVDSLLLDNGNNVLYLSHQPAALDSLDPIFVLIFQFVVNVLVADQTLPNVDEIRDLILQDLYPTLKRQELKLTCKTDNDVEEGQHDDDDDKGQMEEEMEERIWNVLMETKVIDDKGRLNVEALTKGSLSVVVPPDCPKGVDGRVQFLLSKLVEQESRTCVPNYLKPFIELHLKQWIEGAFYALTLTEGVEYVVDTTDKSFRSTDSHPKIIIMNLDTGVDQLQSQWSEGLHQFLQLKHSCRLSPISLKAIFLSNVSYFKKYRRVLGLTGTLGSKSEREFLKITYQSDYVTIPVALQQRFTEDIPLVCPDMESWALKIVERVTQLTSSSSEGAALNGQNKKGRSGPRSALVICENVKAVEYLFEKFPIPIKSRIHLYKRSYEQFNLGSTTQNGLEGGEIILSTNLAGRGTDIKCSDKLNKAGGLFVCLTYLPKNTRVEQQAFGRCARKGQYGSGQLIIMPNGSILSTSSASLSNLTEFHVTVMKRERDVSEKKRIVQLQKTFEESIFQEEKLFEHFSKMYADLSSDVNLKKFSKEKRDIILSDCLDQWAYLLNQVGSMDLKKNFDKAFNLVQILLDKIRTFQNEGPTNPHHILNFLTYPSNTIKFSKSILSNWTGSIRAGVKDVGIVLTDGTQLIADTVKPVTDVTMTVVKGGVDLVKKVVPNSVTETVNKVNDTVLSMTDAVGLTSEVVGKDKDKDKQDEGNYEYRIFGRDSLLWATKYLDKVIQSEPINFPAAPYIKAFVLLREHHKDGHEFYRTLQKCHKMFNKFVTLHMDNMTKIQQTCTALSDQIQKGTGQGHGTTPNKTKRSTLSPGFKEQQENYIQLYTIYLNSIQDIRGHQCWPDRLLASSALSIDMKKCLGQCLRKLGMLTDFSVTPWSIGDEDKLIGICGDWGISLENLKKALQNGPNKETGQLEGLELPSKEEFFDILVTANNNRPKDYSSFVTTRSFVCIPGVPDKHECESETGKNLTNSKILSPALKDSTIFSRVIIKEGVNVAEEAVRGKFVYEILDVDKVPMDVLSAKFTVLEIHDNIGQIGLPKYDHVKKDEFDSIHQFLKNNLVKYPGGHEEYWKFSEQIFKFLQLNGILGQEGQLISMDFDKVKDWGQFSVYRSEIERIVLCSAPYRYQVLLLDSEIQKIKAKENTNLEKENTNLEKEKNLENEAGQKDLKNVDKIDHDDDGTRIKENLTPIIQIQSIFPDVRILSGPDAALTLDLIDAGILEGNQVQRFVLLDKSFSKKFRALFHQNLKQKSSDSPLEVELRGTLPNPRDYWSKNVKEIGEELGNDFLDVTKAVGGAIKRKWTGKVEEAKTVIEGIVIEGKGNFEKLSELILTKDIILNELQTYLEQCQSRFSKLETPDGNLKDLEQFMDSNLGSKGKFLELELFNLNSLDCILILEETRWSWSMLIRTTCILIAGFVQIGAGVAIELFTAGAGTVVGGALIGEGISDIMFAMGAYVSGHCTWEEYMRHKMISLALTTVTCGIGVLFRSASKGSKIGFKIFGTTNKTLAEKTGFALIETAGKGKVAREVLKRIGLKAMQGISLGLANSGVQYLVETHTLSFSRGLSNAVRADVKKRVDELDMKIVIGKLMDKVGELETKRIFSQILNGAKTGAGLTEVIATVSRLATAVHSGVGSGLTKTGVVVSTVLSAVLTLAPYANAILAIGMATESCLQNLVKELTDYEKMTQKSEIHEQSGENRGNFDREQKISLLMNQIKSDLDTHLQTVIANEIRHGIITPLAQLITNKLVMKLGRGIRSAWRNFGQAILRADFKRQWKKLKEEEKITNEMEGEDKEIRLVELARKKMTLLSSYQKRCRSVTFYSELVFKYGAPMGIVEAQAAANRFGISFEFFVEGEDGKDFPEKIVPENGAPSSKTIRMKLQENHFTSDMTPSQKDYSLDLNCFCDAISEFGTPDMIRQELATEIKTNPNLRQTIRNGWHAHYFSKGLYGGVDLAKARKKFKGETTKENMDELVGDAKPYKDTLSNEGNLNDKDKENEEKWGLDADHPIPKVWLNYLPVDLMAGCLEKIFGESSRVTKDDRELLQACKDGQLSLKELDRVHKILINNLWTILLPKKVHIELSSYGNKAGNRYVQDTLEAATDFKEAFYKCLEATFKEYQSVKYKGVDLANLGYKGLVNTATQLRDWGLLQQTRFDNLMDMLVTGGNRQMYLNPTSTSGGGGVDHGTPSQRRQEAYKLIPAKRPLKSTTNVQTPQQGTSQQKPRPQQ